MKKNKLIGLSLIPLLSLLYFYLSSKKWVEIAALPKLHHTEALWFGENTGLIFGSYDWALEKAPEAFILRRTDHRAWKKVHTSRRGKFFSVSATSPHLLYALGGWRHAPADSEFLLKGTGLGETWEELPSPPPHANGIAFYSALAGYLWTSTELFHTKDGALTWQDTHFRFPEFSPPISPVVTSGGTLWMVLDGALVAIGPQGDRSTEALPPNFHHTHITLAIEKDDVLWAYAELKESEESGVFKRTGPTNWEEKKRLPKSLPQALSINPHMMVAIGTILDHPSTLSMFAGLPSIITTSLDDGSSWKEETKASVRNSATDGDRTLYLSVPFGQIVRRIYSENFPRRIRKIFNTF